MTTTLAFDTCLGGLSVAIARVAGGKPVQLLAHTFERRAIGHAEALMPMIARVLAEAALDIGAIDRLAVTLGPGSFTGLRVGIAAARGLALARGLPVVGVTSLAVMAAAAAEHLAGTVAPATRFVVAVDARRDQHYVQAFRADTGSELAPLPDALGDAALLETADAASHLGPAPIVLVGSGGAAIAEARTAMGFASRAALADLEPDARLLALAAHRASPLPVVTPLYIRAPDAKPPRDAAL